MFSVRVTPGRALLVAAFAAIGLLAAASLAVAGPYFNSSEPGCDGSDPNVLWCDDFEDGRWAQTCNDPALAANKGWLLCNSTSLRNPPPPAAICSGAGAGGTNCTAVSTLLGGDGGDSQLALHDIPLSRELYARAYVKFLPGYHFNGNQKFFFSFLRPQAGGGIDFGIVPTHNVNELQAGPQWDCWDDSYHNPQNSVASACYLNQNQGNSINLANLLGRWVYLEVHIRLNDFNVRNGTLEVWANDCGTNGVCTGTPTLRSRYTNVGWRGSVSGASTPNTDIGQIFFDIWGNPGDVGTVYIDQLKVSRVGPIGFMGGSAAPRDTVPPASPGSPQIR
jgi:hypothetical protein